MDITPYVERLRNDLSAAAEGGGPDVADVATRLAYAIDSASRLAIMEAISHAAAEITAEMAEGGVDVRLDGRDLAFVVQHPVPVAAPASPAPVVADDDDTVARVTLRMPESTKAAAEEAAAAAGQSLNTWLVNVVRSATASSDTPFDTRGPGRTNRMTGWV